MRYYYLLLLPVFALIIVFNYFPMYGVLIAFKDYKMSSGILGSEWNNLQHFRLFFTSSLFPRIMMNTLIISAYRIIFGFPAPIILAILLNEVYNRYFKKVVQTISYLPYFMSWVVLAGIIMEILSPARGVINYVIESFGGSPIHFLAEAKYFRSVLIITGIWQGIGWGSIIYLATISSIDMEQYESAIIDGANRYHAMRHITLPSLAPIVVIMFILTLGGILNAGFDQIFNLYNPKVYAVADIIDTFVYRVGLVDMRYGYSAAVGLFKNVVGLFLVFITNFVIKKIGRSEHGIW